MNLFTLALFGVGGVLVYSAVKGQDPRDVVKAALTTQQTPAPKYAAGAGAGPAVYGSPTTDPTPRATGV